METLTNFVRENTHYYGVDSETEKRAGTSGFYSNPYPRFASSNALIVRAKKYYLKPEVLQKLSDGKVSLQKNSKSSFSILTNTSFKIHDIEKTLSSFGESFMNGEGGFGIKFSQTKPNKIFVELDTIQGIKIIPLKIDESNKMKLKEYIQQEIKRQLNESEIDNVKINNPKTGRKIKLTTALGYDKSEKVYHVAKNYLKKNHPDANIDDLVDTDKSKGKSVDSENTNVLINKIYKTKDLNKLKSFYDKLDTKYDEGRAMIKKMDNPIRYESEDEIDQFSSFINDIGVSDKQRSLIRDIHDSITKDPENDKACFEKIDVLMKDFQQGTYKPSNKKAIMSKLENLKTTVEKSSSHEKKIIKIARKVDMYDKIRQHVSDHMSSLRRKQNKR